MWVLMLSIVWRMLWKLAGFRGRGEMWKLLR